MKREEVIDLIRRLKEERNHIYIRALNSKLGSGLRALTSQIYEKEEHIKNYMTLYKITDLDF